MVAAPSPCALQLPRHRRRRPPLSRHLLTLFAALRHLLARPAGIGLLSVRGSGTSGYVQTNKFNLRGPPSSYRDRDDERGPSVKKPNADILEHNRKREIELEVETMRAQLEDEE